MHIHGSTLKGCDNGGDEENKNNTHTQRGVL